MKTFTTILAGAALAAGTMAATADELKLAHFSSTKYHLHNEMFLPLAANIAEATGGDTTIRVYPGGELGAGPVKQYDRVLDGVADIVYALPGYTASQFKKTLLVHLLFPYPITSHRGPPPLYHQTRHEASWQDACCHFAMEDCRHCHE